MKYIWYHFTADVPPEVEAEGPEAVEAYLAAAYEEQAQREHGVSYAELKEFVEHEQKVALEKIDAADAQAKASAEAAKRPYTPPTDAVVEDRRRKALDAAAAAVWSEYPRQVPENAGGAA